MDDSKYLNHPGNKTKELQTNNATVDSSSTQRTTYRHAIFSLFSLLLTFTTTLGETLKFILVLMIRGGSRAAATFKMECFMIIVNGWIPLTIITKHSILDVAAALDLPLIIIISAQTHVRDT